MFNSLIKRKPLANSQGVFIKICQSVSRVLYSTAIYLDRPLLGGSVATFQGCWRATIRLVFLGFPRKTGVPFCLASNGVYSGCMSPYKLIGSYPTFPPLPRKFLAVYFCCPFPQITLACR